jgi:response regulator RpfG family c-di-GMP phosphodiesterase
VSSTETRPAPQGRRVLLVVDDEQLNRDILKRLFYTQFEIIEAPDGLAAQKILEERPIDVIISDHLMPGMSGAELARVAHSRFSETVMLLLTGYDDDPLVTTASREGAIFEVVAKPWQMKPLKDAVARAIAERDRRLAAAPPKA